MHTLRDATVADLPALLAIHNDVVRTSDAIFTEDEQTPAERAAWFAARHDAGFPVVVAERGGEVVAFATYGAFRAWPPGYRTTVEHSVHVRADRRGGGLGTALIEELVRRARAAGLHVMVAAIDAGNHGSLALHERLGFARVATMPEVAAKHGRWLDLVLLQRRLDDRPTP